MVRAESAINSSVNSDPLSPSKRLEPDYDGRSLVFVVGCQRSGTTWLQRLLAAHPKIRTGQESYVFAVHVGPELRGWRGLSGWCCYLTEEEFLRALKTHLLTLLEPMVAPLGSDELFLEKTPDHVLFLPEIFELLPRARVIHILRDARDVVSSLLAGKEWLGPWAPQTASSAAHLWVQHVDAFRNALPKIPREQIHEIRYESLFRSPVPVLQGCADFLDLEWTPAEIAKVVDANLASKARANGGTPIPLYGEAAKLSGPVLVHRKGFIRRAAPGGWKDELSLYDKFRVWRVAHQVMEEVDYHWPKAMESAFAFLSGSMDLAKRRRSGWTSRHG